jgi:hypothetical protein
MFRAMKTSFFLLVGIATSVITVGQQPANQPANFTVSVEVNDSRRATISVPPGRIVIINYDLKEKTLFLSDIKPIDLHPSYVKRGSIFFSAICPGTYTLNWRSGYCRSRIIVK